MLLKRLLFVLTFIILIAAFTYRNVEDNCVQVIYESPPSEPVQIGEMVTYTSCGVPNQIDTSRKVWMDYRTITDRTSDQWRLQRHATTDENGLRRIDEFYMVAVGTYYAERCGEYITIVFEDGAWIDAIVADIKQDAHTDPLNQYTPIGQNAGNVVEFIVDTDVLHPLAAITGDVSPIGMPGNVIEILKEAETYVVKG